MNKVKLAIQENKIGVDFLIKNLNDLDNETIGQLQQFALKRNGYFRYDLGRFDIKRKLNQKQILQIFELLEVDVEIVENDELIIKENSIANEIVDFGLHKGSKWCDVPLSYLEWIYKENENKHAYTEIKRRKYTPLDIENTEINIGKYKGEKWVDLPTDYLKWMLDRFAEEHESYRFAKAVLNQRDDT